MPLSAISWRPVFSGGRSRSTWKEPPIMGKQLVNFITCGCVSSSPFLQFTKPGANPRRIGDKITQRGGTIGNRKKHTMQSYYIVIKGDYQQY
jgi:hypothetical protein